MVGVDVNTTMVAVVRRHGGDIEYREGDGTDLGFEERSFTWQRASSD